MLLELPHILDTLLQPIDLLLFFLEGTDGSLPQLSQLPLDGLLLELELADLDIYTVGLDGFWDAARRNAVGGVGR